MNANVARVLDTAYKVPFLNGAVVELDVTASGKLTIGHGLGGVPSGVLVASSRCYDGTATPSFTFSLIETTQSVISGYFTVTGAHAVILWVW